MRGNFEARTATRTSCTPWAVPTCARARSTGCSLFAARESRVRPGLDDKVLLGERCSSVPWRGRRRLGAPTGWRRLHTNALSSSPSFDDRRRLLQSWQDGRANLLAYAEDFAALLEALVTLAEVDDVAGSPTRAVAGALIALRRRRTRRVLHHRHRRRRLIVRRRTSRTTPRHRRTRWRRAVSASPPSPATSRTRLAERWIRTLAPVLEEHPTAFAYLLEVSERLVTPPLEVAIVGRRPDHRRTPRRSGEPAPPASVRVVAAPGAENDVTPPGRPRIRRWRWLAYL